MKKYLIRSVGALCILCAAAVMFMSSWVQIEGVQRRDLRDMRDDLQGVYTAVSDTFTQQVEDNKDFKEELKDYDLPYTRSKIKAQFSTLEELTDALLDREISYQDLLMLSVKAPGLIKLASNLADSRCFEVFSSAAAEYILFEGSQAITNVNSVEERNAALQSGADQIEEMTQDTVDALSEMSALFVLLTVLLILILVLAVASAATHICNKARWLKYIFLVILVVMVVGSCVALPMVSDLIADSMDAASPLAELSLTISVMPFVSVALMIVPIILDIIYEHKKEKKIVEA